MSVLNLAGIRAAWDNLMFQLEMAERHFNNDDGTASLQSIIFGVAGAVVALIVAVIVLGNLDTATRGTVNESSAYYALLETVGQYGSTAITLLAINRAQRLFYIIEDRSGQTGSRMPLTSARGCPSPPRDTTPGDSIGYVQPSMKIVCVWEFHVPGPRARMLVRISFLVS